MLSRVTHTGAQRGASLVEFQVVAILALLPLLLALLQGALLLIASHTLGYATYQAARSGALAGADPEIMRRALAVGLLPLHAATFEAVTTSNVATVALSAYARSLAATTAFAQLQILSPTQGAFEDFAQQAGTGTPAIRSDALAQRSLAPGPQSGLSIQQANLLHIRVTYCHPLLVPLVDGLLLSLLRQFTTDLHSQACYAAGRVPLQAEAALNMQSDARFHGP
jgi:hypothetical protein